MKHENPLKKLLFIFRQRDFVRNTTAIFSMQAVLFTILSLIAPVQVDRLVLIGWGLAFSALSAMGVSVFLTLRFVPYLRAAALLKKHYEDSDFVHVTKKMTKHPHFIQKAVETILADWDIVEKEHKRLTSLLSHDMRTPLSQIISLCMLLDEETDEAVRNEYLHYIKSQSATLLDMLTDTLQMMQAAGIQIRKTDVVELDLQVIVERVLLLLSSQVNAKQVSVLKDITPGLLVQAEEKRFMLAIVQLLATAVKLSPPDGIVCLKAREAGGRIIISITNHDSDDEVLSQVYEAFPAAKDIRGSLRVTNGNSPSLNLAEQIIVKHNGRFVSGNEDNNGYFFQVHLPICAN
ncbi:MAG: HAMP domain-containing histidine kinase [Filimonas sp.]|nr:HAMP domain-containing histidine kinase [Filimonas sp.]